MKIVYLVILFFSASLTAATIDVRDFAKDNLWSDVKISPKGDYISAVTRVKGKKVIILFNAKTFEGLYQLQFPSHSQPGDYYWASDNRIVTAKEYLKGWSNHPLNYGEFFAVDANGNKDKYIFGYLTAGASLEKGMWGEMLDPMPDDSRYILMSGQTMSQSGEYYPKIYKVNIYKGTKRKLVTSPLKHPDFLIDHNHKVRFVTGADDEGIIKTYLYKNEEWLTTADLGIENESFTPISINGNKKQVYATYSEDGEPSGLYLFDLDSGKKKLIYKNKNVSLSGFNVDKTGYIYAVEYNDSYPARKFLDHDHFESKLLKKMMTDLPGNNISVISETNDGNIKVVFSYNQFNPGEYFLYDVKKKKYTFLFNQRPWVDSNVSANVVPFKFKSRDGIDISAFVTLPFGTDLLKDAKNIPFIVNVHGGPHGVRDYLEYDRENQLFANQGIGVLQVNYRGSGGYGENFKVLGYHHWGDKIQYDIIDGIKALIKKGVADKNKLCIVGGSFGGYSALQSAILEPDLFKCAVGIVGVYDLELMHEIGSIQKSSYGRSYLNKAIGLDKKKLKEFSPLYNLDKLKAAVFVIHGGEDKRVPVDHAEKLIKGLSRNGIEHETMIFDDEGHGFYKPEHREKMFRKVVDFLEKHLSLNK